ncbi:MAG: hypothetical protein ACNA8W_16370, partial [Bradymonadaceae bacterium]
MKFAAILIIITIMGCHGHSHDDDGHSHDDHGHSHDDQSHAHDDHDEAAEDVTIWGEHTQLFVEFRALVTGEESPFAAHLTLLEDHSPIMAGKVTVELSGGSSPTERFAVDETSAPGIFRPIVKPAHPGPRTVTLRFESPEVSEVFELGRFIAFASRQGAESHARSRAEMEDDPEEGVSFFLEEQWRVPFRVEKTEARTVRPGFPAFGRLILPADAQAVINAPRDGRISVAGESFAVIGNEVEAGATLIALEPGPANESDAASIDLAVDRATLRVDSARREVERLRPLAESGIIALADTIESASRTLNKPNPARIRALVDDLVRQKIQDG